MSGTQRLEDTVGSSVVTTELAPEGDRWISKVEGGAWHGFSAVMSTTMDIEVLHSQVVAEVEKSVGEAHATDSDPRT